MKRLNPKAPPLIYEDSRLVVLDKPAGLLTTHTRVAGRAAREAQTTAENLLSCYLRKGQAKSRLRAWLVHRLDRGTSGVLVFAKSEEFAGHLRENWNAIASKTYLAVVEGRMESDGGVFESWLRDDPRTFRVASVRDSSMGKFARTRWRVLSRGPAFSVVEVSPETGRKNQIRVHFADAGHPVAGDVKYGAARASRLMLHAWKLALSDPSVGLSLSLESKPPQEFGRAFAGSAAGGKPVAGSGG